MGLLDYPFKKGQSIYRRGKESKAAERQTKERMGSLGTQFMRAIKATGREALELGKGVPQFLTGKKTFKQIKKRSERKGYKLMTGRLK